MPNKILIVGANGQLGSELKAIENNLTNSSCFFTDVEELDITDKSAIDTFVTSNNINIIINCAAYTNVDKAEDDKTTADLINHKATLNLAQVALQRNAFLVHVSTDYVFDGSRNIPYTEDVPTVPLGVYGVTKLKGEQAVTSSGCKYLIFRTSWLYSAFGNNFVKTMIRLTTEKDKLNVVFDQVGTPTYAGDLAEMIFSIIEKGQLTNHSGIYHFSNEGICSWYDFTKEISLQAGTVCDVQPCHSSEFPSKVTRPSFSVLDKTKIKKDFNYIIPYWKDSLAICMKKLLK